MKHYIRHFILYILILLTSFVPVFSLDKVKILEPVFDRADGIIYIRTLGKITDETIITKGSLKEPERILASPKKSYTGKYSIIKNFKISQFSTSPMVVRMVFEYEEGLNPNQIGIYKSPKGIFIKLKNKITNEGRFKTSYSNSNQTARIPYYMGAQITEDIKDEGQLTPDNKTSKVSSRYYIESIEKTKEGILIQGIGKIGLMPSFTLTEPERLVIDMDDSVLNPELRNKSFPIGEVKLTNENGKLNLDLRDKIKLGQNTQNVVRIVLQGTNAKNYRGIISPDSKSFYITDKSNIIETKISDTNANLIKSGYSSLKGIDAINLVFDNSVAFDVFEENSKLYVDVNNVNLFDNSITDKITKAAPNVEQIRLAMDKVRFVIPNTSNKYLSVKTSPDNDEIRIYSKVKPLVANTPKTVVKKMLPPIHKKNQPEISNLYIVVIDAGHGGSDVGATRNNIYEKDITLKIAKKVDENLRKKNIKTFMIRDKDKTVSLAERSNFSNEKKPDVFVSVHVNSSLNEAIKGVETHYYKDDSIKYANSVHSEFAKRVKSWKTNDRGLFKSQFYVINHTEAPAILCEIGFISNKEEREEIITSKRQEEIADAISEGIYNYLKARK